MFARVLRLMRFLERLPSMLFPYYCLLCGKLLDSGEDRGYPLCTACENSLPLPAVRRCRCCGRPLISEAEVCMLCRNRVFSFDRLTPLYPYQDEKAGALVRAYKKGKRYSLALFWAAKIEEILQRDIIGAGSAGFVIVPVPPRPEKLRSGEQDQVEVLVSILERRGCTVARILAREGSLQQKKLNRSMRKESARKAFRILETCKDKAPVKSVLIDDVFTTGATLDSCAAILKNNGARWVEAIVLAYD